MCLRVGKNPRTIISSTPKPSKLLKSLIEREGKDVVITRGSTFDNRANLAPQYFNSVVSRYEGTRKGRQELNAEVLTEIEGALWNIAQLDELRRHKAPDMKRIVVAVDPAVSIGEDSDETGIIVAGLGVDDHGYVLEDASGKYSPAEWARRVVALYQKYHADRVIAEINMSGLLVEQTLRAVSSNVSYRGVHAKRGKMIRAEPVAALYEQSKVHHVGIFEKLEDQLCTYAGGGDSPDRLDAMVYALTELVVICAAEMELFLLRM